MAKKPTVTNITSGYASNTQLNNNFTALRDAFDNTLSRDGSTPNSMSSDIDLNSNDLLNVNAVETSSLRINGVLVSPADLSSAGSVFYSNRFTGDGSTTAFTLAYDPYIKDNAQVYIDGVYQNKDSYATSGTTLTFTEAPPLNSAIEVAVARTLEAVGTADASTVTFTQAGSGATQTTVNAKLQEFVSVKDFGAVGDGGTDDTSAIQAAIDAVSTAGGGVVTIPRGTYKVTSSIDMKSNVTVECDRGVIIDGESCTDSDVINFTGSVGSAFALDTSPSQGDTSISLSGSPTFAAGDLVHLVSLRNCLSSTDAGTQWLGDGTASLGYAYFAEFAFIKSDDGSGDYTLSRPLIFDQYPITDASETETERTQTDLKKVTPVENAHWIGGEINRTTTGSNTIVMTWCYNCSIKDTVINRLAFYGTAVSIIASYQCFADGVLSNNNPKHNFVYGTDHGLINRFKTIGTMDCGFKNLSGSYGGQIVDFTYGTDYLFSNVRSYCHNGKFNRCYEELTSHPGCYSEEFINNQITDCFQGGLSIRGYQPVIRGNVIYGAGTTTDDSPDTDMAGIQLLYGGPRRATVSDNVVRGMYSAFKIIGSSTLEWQWDNVLVNIHDNEVSECYLGLETVFSSTGPNKDAHRFITYRNNNHSLMTRYIVYLDEYSAGVTVDGNTQNGGFRYSGSGTFAGFVYSLGNCPGLVVTNNTWRRTKGSNSGLTNLYFAYAANISDTTAFPEADWACQSVFEANEMDFVADSNVTERSFNNTAYVQLAYAENDERTSTIASGVAKTIPSRSRVWYMQIDTEGGAATDNLDELQPYTNCVIKEGDVVVLRTVSNSRDVTVRDVATSSATNWGFQTPGGTSITLDGANDTITCVHNGTNHWLVVSNADN